MVEYKVVITNRGLDSLEKIHRFYTETASESIVVRISNELLKEIESLSIFPERKPKLRVTKELNPAYRFAILKPFKIIFRIFEDRLTVYVVEFIHDKESPEKWDNIE